MKTQRCVWGAHTPVTAAEAKPFLAWFNRKENGGFYPYDSSSIMLMIKELLVFNCEVAYDMQVQLLLYLSPNCISALISLPLTTTTHSTLTDTDPINTLSHPPPTLFFSY